MNKNLLKYGLIALLPISIIIAIILIKKYNQKPKGYNIKEEDKNKIIESSKVEEFPLKNGSRGSSVKNLQWALNKLYGTDLIEDGIFGAITENACKINLKTISISKKLFDEIIEEAYNNKVPVQPETESQKTTFYKSYSDGIYDGIKIFGKSTVTGKTDFNMKNSISLPNEHFKKVIDQYKNDNKFICSDLYKIVSTWEFDDNSIRDKFKQKMDLINLK